MDETKIDRRAMGRLAESLAFIIGAAHPAAAHPAIVAMQVAANSGTDKDAKAARALFLKLKPGDWRAAMEMLSE